MVLPRRLARLNKRGLNRVMLRVAPVLPGFGVVTHRGRMSGRTFRVPVNVFPKPDRMVIALTYGADSDWVKNVLAASEFTVRTRGKDVRLVRPRIVNDPTRSDIRVVERAILGLLKVDDFLVADRS